MRYQFPDGKRFAFTIIDDTDVATVENVTPIYRLLEGLGMRTTKTVWPLACPEGSPNFSSSQTMEDPDYRDFVLDLQRRGFEIASHGATMESSDRARTERGLEEMRQAFGTYPRVYVNHANNLENLYWGVDRVDGPLVRAAYRLTLAGPKRFLGHVDGSVHWWGDLARRHIQYVRNLTFESLDVSRVNPTLPYHDPARPIVNWWFSAADAEDCDAFNRILRPAAQDALERHGGVAIVATHLGKGFVERGRVNQLTVGLLEAMAGRRGWFVPVGQLLDWLRESGCGGPIPPAEWAAMQRRWMRDLFLRGGRDRFHRALRS
jgi:hypothetical protein